MFIVIFNHEKIFIQGNKFYFSKKKTFYVLISDKYWFNRNIISR